MSNWKRLASSPLIAAAFLMATSAIGPGFLTQTAVFTDRLGASFAFVILISIILDIGVQLNIWRILAVSGMHAQELANTVLPGSGTLLSALIAIGGLAFNVGNLAGTGLGLQVLTGIDTATGAAISAIIAMFIFLVKNGLQKMDALAKALGVLMIGLTAYVVHAADPPIGLALQGAIMPEKMDAQAVITLVGGTVDYYPDPHGGLHFGGTAGYATLTVSDSSRADSTTDVTPKGFGAAGHVGYSWWIGGDFSLGAMGRVTYSHLTADVPSGVPEVTVKETDFGFVYGARRQAAETDKYYWRLTPFMLPTYTTIPSPQWPKTCFLLVPIDDLNTWWITCQYNPERPMPAAAQRQRPWLVAGTFQSYLSPENDFLIDREMQKTGNYTGIPEIRIQDMAMTDTMPRILDRTVEHLGTTDLAIITMRRLLMRLARQAADGQRPWAADHGEAYNVRPLDTVDTLEELGLIMDAHRDEMVPTK